MRRAPCIGMRTSMSQRSRVRRARPRPSAPSTSTMRWSARSSSARSRSPRFVEADRPARRLARRALERGRDAAHDARSADTRSRRPPPSSTTGVMCAAPVTRQRRCPVAPAVSAERMIAPRLRGIGHAVERDEERVGRVEQLVEVGGPQRCGLRDDALVHVAAREPVRCVRARTSLQRVACELGDLVDRRVVATCSTRRPCAPAAAPPGAAR